MHKISFILPAYKRRFLKEAITSILDQTYRDFELVVVDDCSPENLKEVVDQFHDERLTYHRNQMNVGGQNLVAAWNNALRYATGEWVVCAGDDDVYMPDFAQEMIALTEEYPSVDVFHGRIVIIDENGEVVRLGRPRPKFENGIQMIYHSCVDRMDQRMPDFMYRRSALERVGGYVWSPTAWYTDIMTSVLLSQENGAVCSPHFLLRWRQSGENISSRSDDVAVKIEAGLQFKEWIWKIISVAKPSSPDDGLLLAAIRAGVDADIYRTIRHYWWNVTYERAVSILRASRLGDDIKSLWLKQRFHAEYGFMAILRKLKRRFWRVCRINGA